ncbi:cellulose synthase complex outer membrane protein BcsC [Providencia burhodogranariea]|uniref:Cellulose synthase subunit BcsC n=1 Tax=Providencia burhodogranariea DSM 19968 TaxID=1141662 RepID=K8WBD8_9GAMM|nr:cellulose synthase complex outer membrane protein BcsC [Providencia burhodogranariea]EKT57231.1 cellulose synthase subunit BcsC [Providencia burhodogranariea DSM 19968]
MNKLSLIFSVLAINTLLSSSLYANNSPQQISLLTQIKNGENAFREDIVEEALFRLELIDANNPDFIAAKVRYYLRQGETEKADELIVSLKKISPNSDALKEALVGQHLSSTDGINLLQEARQAVKDDNHALAVTLYDKLFEGTYPTISLHIEYLNVYFYAPNKKEETLEKLKSLYEENPDNALVIETLARRYFYFGKTENSFSLLTQLSGKGKENELIAANLWLYEVQNWPTSTKSISALERMIGLFPTAKEQRESAKKILLKQQQQMKDPAFYSRAEGMRILGSKSAKEQKLALPLLLKGLKNKSNDAELLGEIGLIYSQQGQYNQAVKFLSAALNADKNHKDSIYWREGLNSNKYWSLISFADKAIEDGQYQKAQSYFFTALKINPKGIQALIGLGNTYAHEKEFQKAEQYYLSAFQFDEKNINAIQRITELYFLQSSDKAYQFLESLSPAQKRLVNDKGPYLYSKVLGDLAEQADKKKDTDIAIKVRQQILQLDPDNLWNSYHLAKSYYTLNDAQKAENIIQAVTRNNPNNPDAFYIKSLYYFTNDQSNNALKVINSLPRSQWNENIEELHQQLEFNQVLVDALKLKQAGHEQEAILLIQKLPDTASNKIRKLSLLSDWHLENNQFQRALEGYQQILATEPENESAQVGEIQALLGLNKSYQAMTKIKAISDSRVLETYSINNQRQIANILAESGDIEQANKIFNHLIDKNPALANEDSALVLRDSARVLGKNNQRDVALDRYAKAMVALGMTDSMPENRERLTYLTKHNETDSWLESSIRSDTEDLAKKDDVRFTLEYDYWGSSGKSGYSKLRAQTTMLQSDIPLVDGSLFLRIDNVNLNSGHLKNSEGQEFGTCYDVACSGDKKQRYSGNSLAIGWKNDSLRFDIGTTPLGFEVTDWVGGIEYSDKIGDVGLTFNAHRRPIASSLLAFGGQKDPNTNITWGGVRRTGIGLSGSHDLGGRHGFWGDVTGDVITGKNVANNESLRWMGGYYYKVINDSDRQVSIGLSNMLWHYQKDLSGYTLGQGGYYSPQQYISFGLPINYRQRNEDWSWELAGSVSWSYSHTKDENRYPVSRLIEANNLSGSDKDILRSSGNSKGKYGQSIGYTTTFLVERRITPNWFIGASIDIQQAKDYTPSHALLYLRYSVDGWSGNLDIPPQPLVPYADFK